MARLARPPTSLALLSIFALASLGCGDGAGRDSAGEGPTGTGISTGSATATASDETGSADGEETSTTATTTTASTGEEEAMTDPVKFDVSNLPDAPGGACGGGGGGDGGEHSYIWIANSSQNTISKISTKTIVEEGRYMTRASGGSPSRTSVNLGGDVAVANRTGGITKVIAITENCDPMKNGVPGLQTSSGANDILAWGQDDCVAWHTPINYTANRPAAWTFGTLNPGTCEYENTKFWTAASNGAGANAHAMRLNGDTGAIEDDVLLTGFTVNGYGPYGGAVDPDENFWTIGHSSGYLARVDGGDLTVSVWIAQNMSAYGFTIDEFGRPWIGGLNGQTAVFDPETEQFTYLNGGGLGMGQAANGIMWQATHPSQTAVRGWDINTLQIVKEIQLPVSSTRGVSVDIDGYVWFVEVGNRAFKIDAVAETYQVYDQLVGAYTYSDMTGNALSLVAGHPAG